jgi:hypothetical protein
VVFGEVERLQLAIWEHAVMHVLTIRVVRPPFLWTCERNQYGDAQEGGSIESALTAFRLHWFEIHEREVL